MATTSLIDHNLRRLLSFGLLMALAGTAGCSGGFEGMFARLKRQPIADVVPGVPSPAERMAALDEIRDKAGRVRPAEAQTIAAQLYDGYRQETDPAIRAEIVRTAGDYQAEQAAAVVHLAVSDTDSGVRITACEVLGRPGNPDAAKVLSGVLASDVDGDVRIAAVEALGETGDQNAVAALGEALEDRDPAMQYQAVASLRKITRADLGNNVNDWRLYVRGEIPARQEPTSIAERFRQMF